MSGGYFDYKDSFLKSKIFGYEFGADYGENAFKNQNVPNVFEDKEISELIADIFDLIKSFDWYQSGDTSRDGYIKDKNRFKEKWFCSDEERAKRIIDNTIQQAKVELYETYNIKEEN